MIGGKEEDAAIAAAPKAASIGHSARLGRHLSSRRNFAYEEEIANRSRENDCAQNKAPAVIRPREGLKHHFNKLIDALIAQR